MLEQYCKIFLLTLSTVVGLLIGYVVYVGPTFFVENINPLSQVSLLFIALTTFLTPLCLLVSWEKPIGYFILFLLLEVVVVGFFSTDNLMVFYVLFELSLVPMFFIIGIWGSHRGIYAAYKFFLYTFIASIPFLLSVVYLYVKFGNMNIDFLIEHYPQLTFEARLFICMALFVAFAVKIPMWPFHTWLPDAHVEAPTAASMILAGILIKLGGYAMFRVLLPLTEEFLYFKECVFVLSIIAILYTSMVAFVQTDMKKLIAYSSVAHMGFVTAGLFSGAREGIEGAIFQMLSHGVVSAALFLCVGVLYKRLHSRNIADYSGLAGVMPLFSVVFVFFSMASIGLPGLSGFIGEFFVIVGLFKNFAIYSVFIATAMVFAAMYMLSLCKSVIWGNKQMVITDLSLVEISTFLALMVVTLLMGIVPGVFLDFISIDKIMLKY